MSSGPFAGLILAELGAEVIKVEPPNAPDTVRTIALQPQPHGVTSVFYSVLFIESRQEVCFDRRGN
jgi:crotonobetainyl-CoA:carnitine CoA-transferase CaiB-like acyl-CoA transferase